MIVLRGARVHDPVNGLDGQVCDLHIDNGRIVAPDPSARITHSIDLSGRIVMAGAIDLHTHIGGGKVNIARALLPEDHRDSAHGRRDGLRSGSGHATPATWTTGYRYTEMGYTACFEPAMLPANARQAHLEMGDTPVIDKGAYALLGNDDFLLRLLRDGADQQRINDYVAWTLHATRALGIKVVNAGGISAFKFNVRGLDVDEPSPHYGVTPRTILRTLARAVHELGVPHPLHVHASNLGVPGNVAATLATLEAAEGLPIHLTHIQFHSYGSEGDRKFSSAAARVVEALERHPNLSLDVGQILFGQTVTASGDSMAQFRNRAHAHPRKWVVMDIECDAGCGVVPFRYRDRNFVNALQWAIGLEIFLLARDPWRVFLTTDHPNGAPFTSYPHLIRLLMDRDFRNQQLARLHPDAAALSTLGGIAREYTLQEIAIMTRAAPARILGLAGRGHLGVGAAADIVVYEPRADAEAMFARPTHVFKDGVLVARDGRMLGEGAHALAEPAARGVHPRGVTHTVQPQYDRSIERLLRDHHDRFHTVRFANVAIDADELIDCGSRAVLTHPCVRPT